MVDVSVIIVNFNTRDLLRDCLNSVIKHTKDLDFEVVVFDNDSLEGSVDMLKEEFSNLKIVLSKRNLGFGGGNNAASKYATGDYLFFLNSDTLLTENSIKILFDECKENMAIAPLINFFDRNEVWSSGGDVDLKTGITKHHKDRNAKFCLYLTGCALMLKRELFERLNGFDPYFFFYFEDPDLCVRLRRANISLFVTDKTTILHRVSASLSKAKKKKRFLFTYFNFRFVKKHCKKSAFFHLLKYYKNSIRFLFKNNRKDEVLGIIQGIVFFFLGLTPKKIPQRDTVLVFPQKSFTNNAHLSKIYDLMRRNNYNVLPFSIKNLFKFRKVASWHIHWHHIMVRRSSNKLGVQDSAFVGFRRFISSTFTVWLSKLLGVKIVWFVHEVFSHKNKGRFPEKPFLKTMIKHNDKIITFNRSTADELHSFCDNPVSIVPQGTYDDSYPNKVSRADARKRFSLKSDDKVFLFFGRLLDYKGVDKLIRAWQDINNATLLIGGSSRENPEYGKLLTSLKKKDNVILVDDFILDEDVQFFFSASDFFIVPYVEIGNSGTIYLSLTFDLPVITVDLPSTREFFNLNNDALLFLDNGSEEEIRRCVSIISEETLKKSKEGARLLHQQLAFKNFEKDLLDCVRL